MSGQAAYVGGFAELAKAIANAKALKEGLGGFDNLLGRLMAQSGSSPGEPSRQPCRARTGNPHHARAPGLRGIGRSPSPTTPSNRLCAAIFKTYEIANTRHDHHCEGWLEENLVVDEFCADPATDLWIPITHLSAERRAAMAILAGSPRRHDPPAAHVSGGGHPSGARGFHPPHPGGRRGLHLRGRPAQGHHHRRRSRIPGSSNPTAPEPTAIRPDSSAPTDSSAPSPTARNCGSSSTPPCLKPAISTTSKDATSAAPSASTTSPATMPTASSARSARRTALYTDATLAVQVRHGLKRESALTHNAAALVDSIRQDLMREIGIRPAQAATAATGPEVSIEDLLDSGADDPPPAQPAASAYDDSIDLLLGTR